MQETRGQVYQVMDWISPEEDIITLELEGRCANVDGKPNEDALRKTKLAVIFNMHMPEHKQQLMEIFTNLSIPENPLIVRLNALKEKYVEIKSIQGILRQ